MSHEEIGSALVWAIITCLWHGFTPKGSLSYVDRNNLGDGAVLLVHDFMQWTAGDAEAGERIQAWADDTELLRWATSAMD